MVNYRLTENAELDLIRIHQRDVRDLRAALKEAEHVEADRTVFALNRKRPDAFLSALDTEPKPNVALNKLLHTAAPWD